MRDDLDRKLDLRAAFIDTQEVLDEAGKLCPQSLDRLRFGDEAGNVLGLMCGELVAQALLGERHALLDALEPERLLHPEPGHVV